MAIVLLCAIVVLAACGSDSSESPATDDEGHRFVTERRSTSVPTEIASASPVDVGEIPTQEPRVSPQEMLEVRGAPQFAYLKVDGELVVYDANDRSFKPVQISDNMEVLGYSSSPTGDRVAVLGLKADQVVVQFFGANGEQLSDPISLAMAYRPLAPSTPVATPMTSPASTPMLSTLPQLNIDWVPQGNAVLVSGPGVLQRVSKNGTVMPVSRTGVTGAIVKASWSPMDSQVAIQTQTMEGQRLVFLLNDGHDEATQLEVLGDLGGQSVTELEWLPNGLGVVFVAGNSSDDVVLNGQLYVYRFGDPDPRLLATSGQGGPSAMITHAVVSPDGHSVAYAVMVYDLGEWHLHSLWVRPIKGGPALLIPTSSNAPITALFWTSEGLTWQQGDGQITVVDGEFDPRPLGEAPVATPVASPQATPVTSPVTTPVNDATPRG